MQNPEDKSRAFLESSIKDFKIFIDTCSLLSEQADSFWLHAVPLLHREGKSIIVPLRVCEEVKKFAENPALCERKSDPKLNQRAKAVLSKINMLKSDRLIEIFGDPSDNFADNVFQSVFTKFRLKYNLMLITQDNNLAHDIVMIGKSRSVSVSNRILVERINKHGWLSAFQFDAKAGVAERSWRAERRTEREPVPAEECFAFATSVRNVQGTLNVTSIPGEGASLTAERNGVRKPVKLRESGPSGGEGTIYTTSIPDVVAKIYKPEKLDRAKFEKLSLMMTKSIDCEGVCFPQALLYNQKHEFVGYLMKQARGKDLQRSLFIPQLLKKNFPRWTKVETVRLCVTILKKIKYLHDRNIILGDINPNNILVVSPTEVYFVDTDSYQIEGYPCPVGTINYTAPEIQRKGYSTFLRTLEHERFAVATLLFMLMLPGKPPYSLQGGDSLIDNIINGDFAYASGDRSNKKAPEGPWRYCWSHLPRFLKDDFYETFRKGGEHNSKESRYSTGDWLQKFERYLDLLTSGVFAAQDSMSMDIFPTRLKKNPKATYASCRLCGNEVDVDRLEEGFCQDCLKKGDIYQCKKCGCKIIYTNYQKYIKGSRRHNICKKCHDKKNMIYDSVTCIVCGREFYITYGEKEFFDKKNFQLPRKCKDCRGNKGQNVSSDIDDDADTVFANSGSGLCFITTAACEYFGKADDCYELKTLRQFRDGWLEAQPGGETLIREYYTVAPSIVEALDASERKGATYQDIWENCIIPCVRMIENGDYEACRDLYVRMVQDLKETIAKEN